MKLFVTMRVMGSIGVIIAYFVVLHVSSVMGAWIHLVADLISLPWFIQNRSYDIIVMMLFLLSISMSKIIA